MPDKKDATLRWSVILVSRDGCDTLPRALAALERALVGEPRAEAIVVDNASVDETPRLLAEFAARTGGVLLSEPRPGKSFALNRAMTAASGEWLAFVDDDVMPDPEWLASIDAAAKRHPSAALLAGAIAPAWDAPPPPWLHALAVQGRACGCTLPALNDARCAPYLVKGGNFAVRASQLRGGQFAQGRENFGAEARATGGEDTALAAALDATGATILHVPAARARHIVTATDMKPLAVFRRQLRIGRSDAARGAPALGQALLAATKIPVFGAGVVLGRAIGRRGPYGRSLLGLATNLGRLDHWIHAA